LTNVDCSAYFHWLMSSTRCLCKCYCEPLSLSTSHWTVWTSRHRGSPKAAHSVFYCQ